VPALQLPQLRQRIERSRWRLAVHGRNHLGAKLKDGLFNFFPVLNCLVMPQPNRAHFCPNGPGQVANAVAEHTGCHTQNPIPRLQTAFQRPPQRQHPLARLDCHRIFSPHYFLQTCFCLLIQRQELWFQVCRAKINLILSQNLWRHTDWPRHHRDRIGLHGSLLWMASNDNHRLIIPLCHKIRYNLYHVQSPPPLHLTSLPVRRTAPKAFGFCTGQRLADCLSRTGVTSTCPPVQTGGLFLSFGG